MSPSTSSSETTRFSSQSIQGYFNKADDLKAEILWVLHTIKNHNSYKSNEQIDKLFARMFSDSDIVKGFSCGEKKTAYVCCFGLAPYFLSQLFEMTVGPFVFLFDESLCQMTQSRQMDVYVRQWDPNKQMVAT